MNFVTLGKTASTSVIFRRVRQTIRKEEELINEGSETEWSAEISN